MAFLQVQATGLDEVLARLQRAVDELADPQELLDDLGATLVANIEARFLTKTDPTGQAWAPLAPATQALYNLQDMQGSGPDAGTVKRRGTLLERTGQMLDSLTHNTGPGYVQVGMSRLTDGGQWPLALLHEAGTSRMPARPIFLADWEAGTLGDGDLADVLATIDGWLDELLGD